MNLLKKKKNSIKNVAYNVSVIDKLENVFHSFLLFRVLIKNANIYFQSRENDGKYLVRKTLRKEKDNLEKHFHFGAFQIHFHTKTCIL